MAFFDNQLDSDEKIIYRCRPARRAFIEEYLLVAMTIIIALALACYRLMLWLNTSYDAARLYTVLSGIFFLVALILLIRVELKIWSVRYALTTERIMYSAGILSENFKSTIYSKITDIGLKQSFFDRILNTGTILLDTAGEDDIELVFDKVSRPLEIKRMISDKQTEKTAPIPNAKNKRSRK